MPSVLILEDDLIFLETLIDSFELIGFEVHGFSEIPPVLSIASQRPFDLFATDIRLENAKPSRWLMMAMPWSPSVPDTRMASPGRQFAPLSATPAGTSPTPAVLM